MMQSTPCGPRCQCPGIALFSTTGFQNPAHSTHARFVLADGPFVFFQQRASGFATSPLPPLSVNMVHQYGDHSDIPAKHRVKRYPWARRRPPADCTADDFPIQTRCLAARRQPCSSGVVGPSHRPHRQARRDEAHTRARGVQGHDRGHPSHVHVFLGDVG